MNYHNLTYPDMNNGDGLRVVLWLSGCSRHCKGCQNPQTWDANSGILFDEAAKEELFRELDKDYISGLTLSGGDPLFESNLDDVLDLITEVNRRYNIPQYINDDKMSRNSISSNDADKISLLLPRKSIWLYTGYTISEIFSIKRTANKRMESIIKRQQIITQCSVLIDGKYIDSQRDITLSYRGSKNQRVINIQRTLQKDEIILWK